MNNFGQHEQTKGVHRAKESSLLHDHFSPPCCRSGFDLFDHEPWQVDRRRTEASHFSTNERPVDIGGLFWFNGNFS